MTRTYSATNRTKASAAPPDSAGASGGDPARLLPSVDDEPVPQPFPTDCLPDPLGAMAQAIADCERTPASLAGCCVLGIASASIGAGLQVRSGPNRTTPGNLYLVPDAESGSGKSESFRHAARPFFEFEGELLERWQAETLPGLQAERDILEAELAQLKKDAGRAEGGLERDEIRAQLEHKKRLLAEVEAAIQPPVLSCEDVTTERLASLMAKRGECLASLSPDAGAIVNNLLGRYSKLERTDEGLYLKAFSRDYCRIDRQSREPVVLQSPCLSALWLVQPDKTDTLLAERSLTDGGLIPRLLVCHTNCQPRHITEAHSGIPDAVAQAYAQRIRELLQTYRLNPETRTIDCDPKAMKLLTSHYNFIVDQRLGELRDVTSYAARWNEQAWRISVVLHAALHGKQAHIHSLNADIALQAITLADWYAVQQLQILEGGRITSKRDRQESIYTLALAQPTGITARDVQRHRITRDAAEARELLAVMEADGRLQGEDTQPESGGHVTRIYKPKAVKR